MCNIRLCLNNNAGSEIAEGFLEENEYELMERYYAEIERIQKNSSVFRDFNVSMHFNAAIGVPTELEVKLPEESKVMVALHLMRPFLLNDEALNFNKISNIIKRRFSSQSVQKFVEVQKELFSGKNAQKQIVVTVDDKIIINSEEFLLKYLNAYEYHRDQEKQSFFRELFDRFPEDMAKHFVVSLVIDKFKAIINIGIFIGLIVGKVKEINL